jgi:hypothetical protein
LGTGAVVCERPNFYPSGNYGDQPLEACSLVEGDYKVHCHDDYHDGWHGGFLKIDGHEYCLHFDDGHLKVEDLKVGSDPLPITQKQLDIELDFFSRSFEKQHYINAMNIYAEMKKQGKDPVTGPMGVHTWELYDKAFPFEKVRRYDLVQ